MRVFFRTSVSIVERTVYALTDMKVDSCIQNRQMFTGNIVFVNIHKLK